MDLWKVICDRNSGKVLKGMNLEIITSGSEPSSDDIQKALNKKYDLNLNSVSISRQNWSVEKLS